MQQVSVVALFSWRHAVVFESLPRIVHGVESGGPSLVAERWIRYDVVEGLQCVAVGEERIRKRVALFDVGRGVVVQDHIHPGKRGGRVIFFLSEKTHLDVSMVSCFIT